MAQPQPAKVLRIGIIEDGKIVQERLIKAGETVTVGESAKNTFVFPKTSLPRAEFQLFLAKGNSYVLQFTEEMKGKISSGGAVVALEKLRTDPSVQKQGGVWKLALTEQDRGKISVDNITVLFQFVPPPPAQAVKPIQQMDFRPRLMEDDDPVFLGFLAIFTALAAVLLVWVWNTDPPKIRSLDEIPDRFTKLLLPPEKPPEEVLAEEIDETKTESVEEKEEAKAKAEEKVKEAPKDKVEAAKQREQMKEDVVAKSLLLKMLVTRGESRGGVAEDLFSADGDSTGDLDAALDGVSGVQQATADNQALREGKGSQQGDVDIGDLNAVKTGETDVAKVKVTVKPDVQLGGGEEVDVTGDVNQVKATVKKNFGQLTYCYEQRLKQNPSLSGRVEVEWNVLGGRVTHADVFANTTGDAELGTCIVAKIKRWTFPLEVEGEMLYPFIFKPKN